MDAVTRTWLIVLQGSALLERSARVLGGYYHLCAAAHERGDGARTKLATFYIHSLLPEYSGLLAQAMQGADDLYALGLEELAG